MGRFIEKNLKTTVMDKTEMMSFRKVTDQNLKRKSHAEKLHCLLPPEQKFWHKDWKGFLSYTALQKRFCALSLKKVLKEGHNSSHRILIYGFWRWMWIARKDICLVHYYSCVNPIEDQHPKRLNLLRNPPAKVWNQRISAPAKY